MRNTSRLAAAVAALWLMAACSDATPLTAPGVRSGVSAAITASSCQAELDALRSAISGATFTGKNASTNKANLLLKIDEAQAKLAGGKPADAIQKLEDIRATTVALTTPDANGKTKLDAPGAAAIIAAVDAAELCIQGQASSDA